MCPEKERYMMDLRLQVTVYEARRVSQFTTASTNWRRRRVTCSIWNSQRRPEVCVQVNCSSKIGGESTRYSTSVAQDRCALVVLLRYDPFKFSQRVFIIIIDREQQELVDGMDCPENIFVQQVLEQLKERREKVASVRTVNQAAGSKADSCNWLENVHCAVCGTADTVRSRLSTPKRS
ncbi:hypothetical protein pipiens_001658 [Culex pipiens pipiens]|uniref:Uncharacterized protein n=1 Tax=Culex pipiens pipiens TaxID=38569 RepID=A0ABD1CD88_CULPP